MIFNFIYRNWKCFKSKVIKFWYYTIDKELLTPIFLDKENFSTSGKWNRFLGNKGELLAYKFLKSNGLKILYRNFKCTKGGEIDIVYRDEEVLVFCEVKTRSKGKFGEPAYSVNKDKRELIIRAAHSWLRELYLRIPNIVYRFDIIEVILENKKTPKIRLSKNAFNIYKNKINFIT